MGPHGDHVCQRGHIWDNEAEIERVTRRPARDQGRRTARRRVDEMAMRVPPERRVAPAPGPPGAAVAGWSADAWTARAIAVLKEFCEGRTGPFTTPEDVWPLLPTPREQRAMVVPVRHALRHGWIAEVGARRLTGVYRTADGDQFRMNKLVPVYRSLISKDA